MDELSHTVMSALVKILSETRLSVSARFEFYLLFGLSVQPLSSVSPDQTFSCVVDTEIKPVVSVNKPANDVDSDSQYLIIGETKINETFSFAYKTQNMMKVSCKELISHFYNR